MKRGKTNDEDQRQWQVLLRNMVTMRKGLGITQYQMAERMGIKQPRMVAIEKLVTGDADVHITTLFAYARALGVRLVMTVEDKEST